MIINHDVDKWKSKPDLFEQNICHTDELNQIKVNFIRGIVRNHVFAFQWSNVQRSNIMFHSPYLAI